MADGDPLTLAQNPRVPRKVGNATMTTEEILVLAWRFAALPEFEELWRETIWPLIFRIETARRNGDVDGHAEDALFVYALLVV